MLIADQIDRMFPDLSDPRVDSALALVHQRFSTNTFPSWPLAHPYRYVAHNGEINTLRGNINWMKAREALMASELFGDDLQKILPIIREGGSDTATFDNVLEFLVMAGRSLPHAILMMIPEPWTGHESMSPERRAFYEFHSSLMEPWDGPASIAFTDGTVIGAVLDRNGLRPSRYSVTKDDLVIMASETGVLDIAPENVLVKERLHPGRIFLVDTAQGRIVDDDEVKDELAKAHPYGDWLKENLVAIEDLPDAPELPLPIPTRFDAGSSCSATRKRTSRSSSRPWRKGEEPVGSMGNDAALAVLSDRPRLLYDYFAQLFAQVTNPPLDAIREKLVTSMESTVGPEGNLLKPTPQSCRQIGDPVSDHRQRAAGQAASHPARRLPVRDAADAVRSGRRRPGPRASDGGSVGGGREGRPRRRQHPDSLGPRRQRDRGADPEPARDRRRAPPSGSHWDCARGAGWSSNRATRAKCITSRCSWATAPARSTPTWRSRRSPISCVRARSKRCRTPRP